MTKIITKNSSTAGAAPSASNLVQGELAVNVTDKKLYTKNNSNAIVADDSGYYEPANCVERNVQHLQLMVGKDFWTTEDMAPLNAAITAGLSYGS